MKNKKSKDYSQLSLFSASNLEASSKPVDQKSNQRDTGRVISFDQALKERHIKLSQEFRSLSDDLMEG
jgi:hypothetical protein